MDVFEQLGVPTIINAAGTFTDLGGSLMSDATQQAWREAATAFVDMHGLQARVGELIAQRLGVPAAMVTGGAASGLMLAGLAAKSLAYRSIAARSRENASGIAVDAGTEWRVLRPAGHPDPYDAQLAAAGLRVVPVASAEEFAQQAGPGAVLAAACYCLFPESAFSVEQWVSLTRRHGLPSLLDAAADVPPVRNLWQLHQQGFDLVAFSGGKAIRGPQDTGLLLGRADLIEAAKRQAAPYEGVAGRVAKVSKEDLVAFWGALQEFLQHGDQLGERARAELQIVYDHLVALPSVTLQWCTPPLANHFPHLVVDWDQRRIPLTVAQLQQQLRTGEPPIATDRVHGIDAPGLVLSGINLQPGEADQIGRRLRELL